MENQKQEEQQPLKENSFEPEFLKYHKGKEETLKSLKTSVSSLTSNVDQLSEYELKIRASHEEALANLQLLKDEGLELDKNLEQIGQVLAPILAKMKQTWKVTDDLIMFPLDSKHQNIQDPTVKELVQILISIGEPVTIPSNLHNQQTI